MRRGGRGWWWAAGLGLMAGGWGAAEPATKLNVHVLPLAFSAESRRNYGEWITKMEGEGYGQAVWQELEDFLYDEPAVALVQSPLAEDALLEILRARLEAGAAGPAEGEALVDLPEQVIAINANVFTRRVETLTGFKARQSTDYHVTLHLRFYDLTGGKLNRAVPARGSAVGAEPIGAARAAVRAAATALLERLRRSGVIPAGTGAGAAGKLPGEGG